MNDLYLTPVGMEQRQDPYELIIPESFEEALTYEEQILWILAHKQDLLVEGDNITLTPNEDGTVTISSEGGQGATYRIETATPDEGYTAAYILKNVDTGQQSGVKIQVPTVAGPQGATGPAGPGVPAGGTVGQVLKKSGSGDYETNWEDPSGGLPSGGNPYEVLALNSSGNPAWIKNRYIGSVRVSSESVSSLLTLGPKVSNFTIDSHYSSGSSYVSQLLNGMVALFLPTSGSSSALVEVKSRFSAEMYGDITLSSAIDLPDASSSALTEEIITAGRITLAITRDLYDGYGDTVCPTFRGNGVMILTDTTNNTSYVVGCEIYASWTSYRSRYDLNINIMKGTVIPAGTYKFFIMAG